MAKTEGELKHLLKRDEQGLSGFRRLSEGDTVYGAYRYSENYDEIFGRVFKSQNDARALFNKSSFSKNKDRVLFKADINGEGPGVLTNINVLERQTPSHWGRY